MTTLTETIAEYKAADARFAPYREALVAKLQGAIDTYKRIGKEHGLYLHGWDYGWTGWMGWINLADIEIYDSHLYIEYDRGEHGDGTATLTFDEIENAEVYAIAAAEKAKAKQVRDTQADKAAKRRELERQLAALDR